jgi:hypothetical protein
MHEMEHNMFASRHLKCHLQVGCRVEQEENYTMNKHEQIHNVDERGLLLNKRVTKLWMNRTRETRTVTNKDNGRNVIVVTH